MKKIIKFLLFAVIIFAILIAGAAGVLYFMYPAPKLKLMAQNYVQKNFNRQIDFSHMSFNIVGVTVKDLMISEASSFEQGTFIQAKKAVVKIQLRPLFAKKIKIDTVGFENLEVNLIKNKDGKFNFDDLITEGAQNAQEQQAAPDAKDGDLSYDVTADDIYLKNATLNFQNKQAQMSFSIKGANLTIKNFDFSNFFDVNASAATAIKTDTLDMSPINIALAGKVKLANFNMEEASAQISSFTVSYKNAALNLQGSADNFAAPSFSFDGFIKGIDSNFMSEFASGPLTPFALPQVNMSINGSSDIEKSFLKLTNATASVGSSYISSSGSLDYSTPQLKYSASLKTNLKLKEISDIAKETLSAFKLQGVIDGYVNASGAGNKHNAQGSFTFKDIGALVLGKQLKNLNGGITIAGIDDIKTNNLRGFFDNSNFTMFFSYARPQDAADINFVFNMDKFTLENINFDTLFDKAPKEKSAKRKDEEKPAAEENPKEQDVIQDQTPRTIPMNINASITVKTIANNIFSTENLVIKANVKNVDNKFDRANGQITFSSQNGEIKDINKLMSSSVVLKVIFTSVRVIQKAFNVLRLDKMTLGNDTIRYSLIEGAYGVANGMVTIEKSDIYSDLTTVKSVGTIDLLTEKLNMTVNSHFGKVTEGSGFRPVVIKIGGTLSDPSFKVDIASTVTSLINVPGQVVRGGVKISTATVSGGGEAAGSIVKGIAGLFQKKSK